MISSQAPSSLNRNHRVGNRSLIILVGLAVLFLFPRDLVSASRMGDREAVESCRALYAGLNQPLFVSFTEVGPRLILPAWKKASREFSSLRELRLGTYNVLNLEEFQGKYALNPKTGLMEMVSPPRTKAPHHLDTIAKTILQANPDILFLQEVESISALKSLTVKRLDEQYRVLSLTGNDERGIDIAFLIKKDLPFDVELQSYRNQKLANEKRGGEIQFLHTRDLPVITLKKAGEDEVVAYFIGVHLKSQRDSMNDPRSFYRRNEQVKGILSVFSGFENKDAPVFVIGDFNAEMRNAPELKKLKENGFVDAFDLAAKPLRDRITHSYHPTDTNRPHYSQMDGVMVHDRGIRELVERGEVIPYYEEVSISKKKKKGKKGKKMKLVEKPLPKSHEQRKENPSDHRMVSVVIDFKKIRKFLNLDDE